MCKEKKKKILPLPPPKIRNPDDEPQVFELTNCAFWCSIGFGGSVGFGADVVGTALSGQQRS